MATDNFILSVEGKDVDVRSLMCHFQQDPYPAGKRYELHIDDTDVILQAKKLFGIGRHHHLDSSKQSNFLSYLFPIIGMKCGRVTLRFWANTIEFLEVSETEVVLNGVCSSHVSE